MTIIAFDCDGTLQTLSGNPRWEVIDLLRQLSRFGYKIVVWSGGGKSYAESVVRRLQLSEFVTRCASKTEARKIKADVCFDDELTDLALVSLPV